MNLNITWFILLGVLLAGYAILDGFDLGVGILHLAVKDDTDRRVFMNSIGPLWDGNEVWLVTFGGALFAAFPNRLRDRILWILHAFMALLFALIFRVILDGISQQARQQGLAAVLGHLLFLRQHAGYFFVRGRRRQCDARHADRRRHQGQFTGRSSSSSIPTPCWSACSPSRPSRCTARSIYT